MQYCLTPKTEAYDQICVVWREPEWLLMPNKWRWNINYYISFCLFGKAHCILKTNLWQKLILIYSCLTKNHRMIAITNVIVGIAPLKIFDCCLTKYLKQSLSKVSFCYKNWGLVWLTFNSKVVAISFLPTLSLLPDQMSPFLLSFTH